MAEAKTKEGNNKLIAQNRKARFNYTILDTWEAGLQLLGSEVKSIRAGRVDFRDAHAAFTQHELFLLDLHVPEYAFANQFNHEPMRPRKLLLNRHELTRLQTKIKDGGGGTTLVPTKLYFKNGRVKVEIGLAKGKREYDKRQAIRKRDAARDED